jgi:predicted negative regulator of RcsB-dependent stress response
LQDIAYPYSLKEQLVREDLEQQEQMEALKGWWKENQRWVLGLLVVASLGLAGYTGWNYRQASRANEATVLLEALNKTIEAQDLEKAKAAAQPLFDRFAGLAQADIAALQLARLSAASGDLDGARAALTIAQGSRDPALAWIARIRMAGVLLDQGKPDDALKALDGSPPEAVKPLVDDRRGDVLAALNRHADALAAWTAARAGLGPDAAPRTLDLIDRKMAVVAAQQKGNP